jgi:hypothetical protein
MALPNILQLKMFLRQNPSVTFRLSCARLRKRGLRIVERVSIQVEPTENAANYLRTKKEKLGHLLDS